MSLAALANNKQVSDFLLDPAVYDILDKVATTHGLPTERSEEFLDLTEAVMDGVASLDQMPMLLGQAFGLDDAASQKLAADVAGYRLLPLENYLPGVKEHILAWGGKIEAYPTLRVAKEKLSALEFTKRVSSEIKLELTDVLQKRLAFLLQEFIAGKKNEAWLKDFLLRPSKVGGVGLAPEQAQLLLTKVVAEKAEVEIIDPDAMNAKRTEPAQTAPDVVEVPSQLPEVAPTHELAVEVPVVNSPQPAVATPVTAAPKTIAAKPVTKLATDDVNVDELRASAKKATMVRKQTAGIKDSFAAAVALATEKAAPVLKKKKISDKVFADIAGKAIRGLRDIYQTRDQVEREWDLKGDDLAVFMDAIAVGVSDYNSRAAQSMANGDGVDTKDTQPDETSELNKRFDALTSSDTANAVPAKAKAQLTVGSVPVQTADGQRKVVDIVSAARLAGPIEQLGKMVPSEFRRLSSDPAEAAQKIDDLLSALEATSYEERVKGVLAWRESPMNQLYLQITEEALAQGLALPEVSSRRRAAGKESLSPAEIKALALLNTKIRF